jgi:hypothetical protein
LKIASIVFNLQGSRLVTFFDPEGRRTSFDLDKRVRCVAAPELLTEL